MRKILPLFIFLFVVSFSVQAQVCVPDGSVSAPGFYPDTINGGLDTGFVSMAYDDVITIIVPADTTLPIVGTVTVDSISLSSFTGLPPGLSFDCEPAICTWVGNSTGCVSISGTPTLGGVYPITANVDLYAGGVTIALPYAVEGYRIAIVDAVSVGEVNKTTFGELKNQPNPFRGGTQVSFVSEDNSKFEFQVFDLLGNRVFNQIVQAQTGANVFHFQNDQLVPGIYLYSLSNGKHTATARMIVAAE